MLPFPRNERFIGREEQLEELKQCLLPSNTHRCATIYGVRGCGKSALALEFAYRTLASHAVRKLVFWVPAISRESFELTYREIGIRLRIPGITDDNTNVQKLVKDALGSETSGHWLMIVDNVNDRRSAQLSDYLPHNNRGTILFITRSMKIARGLKPSSIIDLYDMSKAEARQLLARHITNQAFLDHEWAIDLLLERLTYLPLAIVQAAAFMDINAVSVSDYEDLLYKTRRNLSSVIQRFAYLSKDKVREDTVALTWYVSFNKIRRQDPLAAEYLLFMACIDCIDIPQTLLPSGGSLEDQKKALATLIGYAFITERQQTVLDPDRLFDED
jgi:hypothetical protein